jgi:hypothetical protein
MLKSHEDVCCIQDYDDEEDDELNYVERKTLTYLQTQKQLKDKEILAKKLLKDKASKKLHRNCFLDESDEYDESDWKCNYMESKRSLKDIETARNFPLAFDTYYFSFIYQLLVVYIPITCCLYTNYLCLYNNYLFIVYQLFLFLYTNLL